LIVDTNIVFGLKPPTLLDGNFDDQYLYDDITDDWSCYSRYDRRTRSYSDLTYDEYDYDDEDYRFNFSVPICC
jgi:hypothetical protein